MGLITKVRGRVKGRSLLFDMNNGKNPNGHYYNLFVRCNGGCSKGGNCYDLQKSPETIVVLLLLPFLMGRIGLLYACIIYQYPLHYIRDWLIKWAKHYWFQLIFPRAKSTLTSVYAKLDKREQNMVNMNIYVIINQTVFFTLCDRSLGLIGKERVTSLYSLLFYNVIAYCFSYVKEVIEKEDWSMSVHLTPSSNIRHLAMSATKIVLEWTKAVTFIVTVVCMLIVLGLEQGLENYCPTRKYILITFTYYILTEKSFQEWIPNLLRFIPYRSKVLGQEEITGLEKLYAMIFIKTVTMYLNLFLLLPVFLTSPRLSFVVLYFNIYLQYKSMSSIKNKLQSEVGLVSTFRLATKDELECLDDVCVICLSPMEYSKCSLWSGVLECRVTPCQHVFHTSCLRLCVKNYLGDVNSCPICKRDLKPE